MPAYDLLDMEYYLESARDRVGMKALEMIVSRGCSFQCGFCSTEQKGDQYYPAETVVETIAELTKKYGAEGVWFKDSNITADPEWLVEFCEKIIAKDLNVKFAASTRIDRITDDLLEIMEAAGFDHLFTGIESGTERSLNILRKYRHSADSGEHVKKTKAVFKKCNELGINITGYFMIGIPGEDVYDVISSVDLANELRETPYNGNILWRVYNPLPGSELFGRLKSEGRISGKDTHFAYHVLPDEYPYGYNGAGTLGWKDLSCIIKALTSNFENGGPKVTGNEIREKYVSMGLPRETYRHVEVSRAV